MLWKMFAAPEPDAGHEISIPITVQVAELAGGAPETLPASIVLKAIMELAAVRKIPATRVGDATWRTTLPPETRLFAIRTLVCSKPREPNSSPATLLDPLAVKVALPPKKRFR
jgi:hypothetical protein